MFWSFHPLMGKVMLEVYSPAQSAWLRYNAAALVYIFWALFQKAKKMQGHFAQPKNKKDILLIFMLGAMPFAFSPILQFSGLSHVQSVDNALVIAIEPLFNVFLAWIVLRERLSLAQALAFCAALIGFMFLSKFDPQNLKSSSFIGFVLMLMALWGEATYAVLGRLLVRRYSPLPLFGSAIIIGAILLSLYLAVTHQSFPDISLLNSKTSLALFWLGPVGTTISYILWMKAAHEAPVATLSLTLFIQPLMGTAIGFTLRDESLTYGQFLGGAMILAAVTVQYFHEIRKN